MLGTNDRQLFLESIRPPTDYELDFLIGTTFSLDLVALLTTPLAFTMFESQDASGEPLMDPLVLLEALRRNADKLSIFCQAGQIYTPQQGRTLFAYLEKSVHEVTAPSAEGVFHPKVWVGRFVRTGHPTKYKILIQSRNLTFDRSWDVMVCLDGEVLHRQNGISRNHPLADFVATLPELLVHPLNDQKVAKIELIQSELRRLELDLPDGVNDLRFHPLGIKGYQQHRAWPFDGRIDRMLIVSPFLTGSCLDELAVPRAENILISRQESLDSLDGSHLSNYTPFVMLDEGLPEVTDEADDANPAARETSNTSNAGLHAKVYVSDEGWDARTWLGSANATHHAFNQNVEFLVELQGRKSRLGIASVLGNPDEKWSLSRLLTPYQPPQEALDPDNTSEDAMNELEQVRKALATSGMVLRLVPATESEADAGFDASLSVTGVEPAVSSDVRMYCRPISLPDARSLPILLDSSGSAEVRFSRLTMDALTSFISFRLEHRKTGDRLAFVCNVQMEGEPESRRARILQSLLTNQSEVLRYILLLLSEGDGDPLTQSLLSGFRESAGSAYGEQGIDSNMPLFESLVKALHTQPKKLEQLQSLVTQLQAGGNEDMLPRGFLDIWQPIWEVAKEAAATS